MKKQFEKYDFPFCFLRKYTSQSQDTQLLLAPACQKIFERPKYPEQVCRAQNRYVLNNDVRWTRDRSQEPTPPSAHSPPKTPSPLFSPILPHNETHLRFKSQGRVVRGATSCCISPPLPKAKGGGFSEAALERLSWERFLPRSWRRYCANCVLSARWAGD